MYKHVHGTTMSEQKKNLLGWPSLKKKEPAYRA